MFPNMARIKQIEKELRNLRSNRESGKWMLANGTEFEKVVKQYVGSSSIIEDEYFEIVRGIRKDSNKLYKAYQAKESSYIGFIERHSTVFLTAEEAKQLEQEVQAFNVSSEEVTIDGDGFINTGTA